MPSPKQRRRQIRKRQVRRTKPIVILGRPDSRIKMSGVIVRNTKDFGGIFKGGQRVMRVHVQSANPREIILRLKFLKEEVLPKLKEKGFAGIFGDTMTRSVAKRFVENFGARAMEPPAHAKKELEIYYEKMEKERNFRKEDKNIPPLRLVVSFGEHK